MAPPHIETRYLRGGCVAFAAALHRELKLPVYVLADLHNGEEDWIHAFAADEKQGLALDVRGPMELDARVVARGARIGGIPLIRPASINDISFRMDRHPTNTEIDQARAAVRKFVQPVYERPRLAPATPAALRRPF
ncbi:hypothetical protein O9X98_04790 [Agrobacterium salinitolerans]|nr:hypothetical protein [Agrobacterium salinitolerans]